ncbi:Mitochondrial ATPase complex subunit atp10 [Physocladia obscura]|uniref:Mitochondrial ATPase complex subunit atp10 n=1 Tax=Physocladia obscura TaxID=109957 RepID=A0AAD5T7K1_9FUNG|nr:Mitochondrial ATPase complex subunit atp10 [Physocladia obscura]
MKSMHNIFKLRLTRNLSSKLPPGAENQAPKLFVPPPVLPPPQSQNLGLVARFQKMLERDAKSIEENRKNPDAPTSNFIYRNHSKLEARIKALEEAELKRREQGLSSKMGPTAQKIRSKLSGIFDSQKNEEERKLLMDAAFKKGRFDDLKEIAQKGVKLWTAPKMMKFPLSSPKIPNISGKSLLQVDTDIHSLIKSNKVTLVAFFFNALGEPHVKSYIKPLKAEIPDIPIVQLNIEEDWSKSWALQVFERWIKRNVPKEMHATYLIHRGSIISERTKIGMDNKLVGWVHLVDSIGRVRWSAHGPAEEEEIKTLISSVKELLSEP